MKLNIILGAIIIIALSVGISCFVLDTMNLTTIKVVMVDNQKMSQVLSDFILKHKLTDNARTMAINDFTDMAKYNISVYQAENHAIVLNKNAIAVPKSIEDITNQIIPVLE